MRLIESKRGRRHEQEPGKIKIEGGEDMANHNLEQFIAFLTVLKAYAESKGEYFTADLIRKILYNISR